MTEDDTFETLRRLPFSQMRILIIENNGSTIDTTSLLAQNGWTVEEYHLVWLKWNNGGY